MTQPTLFDRPADLVDPVRSSDPDTSAIGAESIRESAVNDRARIVGILRAIGPATTDQVRSELRRQGIDRDRNVVASRISQLCRPAHGPLVEDTGRRATKPNGRPVAIWGLR